jgi:uncharacterized repeat protein (TIGR01451 family)
VTSRAPTRFGWYGRGVNPFPQGGRDAKSYKILGRARGTPAHRRGDAGPGERPGATADLAITKSDSPDPVRQGQALTYTIQVTNLGPETAQGVTVTDTLDSHVDFGSAAASQGTCDRTGKEVTCSLGELAASSSSPATVTLRVIPKKTGTLSNSATVTVGQGDNDPNAANDTDAESTTVLAAGGGGGGGGGAVCAGHAATIVGTGGPDTLTGTSGRDVIKARGGNDLIRALQGKDLVCAGGGNDKLKGGSGNDKLKGGSGRDALKGGGGGDRLLGGPGRDRCRGGAGRDIERSC